MTKKLYYSNDDMLHDLNVIYRKMARNVFKPDVIVGVTRGGLIPAVYASHYFGVPLLTINVSLRDFKAHEEVDEIMEHVGAGKNVLIVDDICDSGDTLKLITDKLHEQDPLMSALHVKTAVLIHNTGETVFDPDYSGLDINKREDPQWVVFSWEVDE